MNLRSSYDDNGFRDRRIQPLCQLSNGFIYSTSCITPAHMHPKILFHNFGVFAGVNFMKKNSKILTVGLGFEPRVDLRPQQFSRLPLSTAQPPHRKITIIQAKRLLPLSILRRFAPQDASPFQGSAAAQPPHLNFDNSTSVNSPHRMCQNYRREFRHIL